MVVEPGGVGELGGVVPPHRGHRRTRSGLPRFRLTRGVRWSGRVSGLVERSRTRSGSVCRSVLSASAVVGPFDPGDDGQAELVAGGPAAAVQDVLLQQREEGLHRGVVGAGPDPAHRPVQAGGCAARGRRRESGTGCPDRSARRCRPAGAARPRCARAATASWAVIREVDRVADDPVGADVLDRAQVELALGGGVLGDVGQPQQVRRARGEAPARPGRRGPVGRACGSGPACVACTDQIRCCGAQPVDPVPAA